MRIAEMRISKMLMDQKRPNLQASKLYSFSNNFFLNHVKMHNETELNRKRSEKNKVKMTVFYSNRK